MRRTRRAVIGSGWTLADPLPDSPADTLQDPSAAALPQDPSAAALPRTATRRRQDPSDYTVLMLGPGDGWHHLCSLRPVAAPSWRLASCHYRACASMLGTYTSTLSLPPPAFSPCAAAWISRHPLLMLVRHCRRRIPLDFPSRGAGLPYFLAGFPVPHDQATPCCAFLFLSFFLSPDGPSAPPVSRLKASLPVLCGGTQNALQKRRGSGLMGVKQLKCV